MALTSQLQYYPAKHLIGAALIIFVVVIMLVSPDLSKNTKQTNYTIDIQSSNHLDNESLAESKWESDFVRSGDSLSTIFDRANLSPVDVIEVAAAAPREALTLRPNQKIRWQRSLDNRVSLLELEISPLAHHIIERDEEGQLQYELSERTADYIPRFAQASINGSLLYDGGQAGIPTQILYQLISIYNWDIDFALDLRKGDTFSLVYEEIQLDGETIGYGDILISRFNNLGRELTAVRHTDSEGETNYFTPEGKSMRKAFLRNPIDFARISSRFNLKRKHPVLNKIRAHRGTDYAAATGTPIKTVGNGKVTFAGRQRGFGNVVIIQHGARYQTKYAHMSKFGRGIRKGKYVKQGQIIGYVGMTGLATGPHLHYEFLVDGVHRDSLRVKLPKAESISSKEKAAFGATATKYKDWLDNYEAIGLSEAGR